MKVAAVLIAAGGILTAGGSVVTLKVAICWHREHERRLDAHDTRLRSTLTALMIALEEGGIPVPAEVKEQLRWLNLVRQEPRSHASGE